MTAQTSPVEVAESFLPAGMTVTARRLVAFAVSLSAVLSVMESTVVSAVLPSVTHDLGGLSLYRWVAAGYLLATAVTVPVYGRLADVYGRRVMYYWSLLIFLIGSAASGAALNIEMLIVFRVIQGLGAGGLMVVATTILSDIYTPAERAKIQGAMSVVWGSAAAAGPLLGTLILQYASWRWAFYINVPVGVLIIGLIHRNYIDTHEHRSHRFDVIGFLLLSIGISTLLLSAGEHVSLPGIAASFAILAAFILHERRTAEPLLPLQIAWRRAVALPAVVMTLLSAAVYGLVTYLPLYSSLRSGGSVANAGLVLTPLVIGSFMGSLGGGRLAAIFSLKGLALTGAGMSAAATVVNVLLIYFTGPLLLSQAALFIFGFGYGQLALALMLIVQGAAAKSERGTANAVFALARSLGTAMGVGLLGSFLATGNSIEGMDAAALQALVSSLHVIFIAVSAVAVIGFLFAFVLPAVARLSAAPVAPAVKEAIPTDPLVEV